MEGYGDSPEYPKMARAEALERAQSRQQLDRYFSDTGKGKRRPKKFRPETWRALAEDYRVLKGMDP